MALRRRAIIDHPAYYFVTATTYDHNPCFQFDAAKIVAEERLLRTANEKNVKILAYVIMSTHLHFVGYFPEGGLQLSKLMLAVKGRIRKDLIGDFKLWEARFDGKLIKSEKMLAEDIEYIHNNPVKADISSIPEDYQYSSAAIWAGIKHDERVFARFGID